MTVDAPLVATFHCYSENAFSNGLANFFGAWRRLNRLHVRIAVSQAAAWTGRRFYGGTYRVIPNGGDVPARAPEPRAPEAVHAERPLRVAFVGQAVERKGLPVLLRAFEALREHVPATLDVVGVGADELAPLMRDPRDVVAHGKCSDEAKTAVLREADVL
ncbi:MAG TPA: phosphatidylinositol alpha-mannosyltransferase, partial [Solirubrobacteraceae bacterium]|nr:phosphatidylinositol alpha-mannosyltransferase [Solirubrobacteraceae bacterium]